MTPNKRYVISGLIVLGTVLVVPDTQGSNQGPIAAYRCGKSDTGCCAHRLGRKALADVAQAARPDTILGWYRKLVARKFDGSKSRRYPGRPRIDGEIEELVVRMARENPGWGYDRIVGAMANLGHTLSDQTVGNILQRNCIPPAPARKRTTTWADFIRAHMAVLAGTDFFSVEVLTLRGLVTYSSPLTASAEGMRTLRDGTMVEIACL